MHALIKYVLNLKPHPCDHWHILDNHDYASQPLQFQADLSRSTNQSEVLINSHRVQINTALSAGYRALTAPVAHGTFKLVLYCCLCVCMCDCAFVYRVPHYYCRCT